MGTKLIKRYANRKLYDTDRSCYVTLDEIREMVKAGDDLKIIDNRSGDDLTSVTLTQILYEEQKKASSSANPVLPLNALRGIIQSGGSILSRLGSPVTKMGDDLKRRAGRLEEGSQNAVREFLDGAQRTLDETQQQLNDRVRDALSVVSGGDRKAQETEALEARIQTLEQRVKWLESRLDQVLADNAQRDGRPPSLPAQKSNPRLPL